MQRPKLFALGIFALQSFTALSHAGECFRFQPQGSPERNDLRQALPEMDHAQTWCYEKRTANQDHYLFIYNADSEQISPELTAAVKIDAQGNPISATVGNYDQGKINFTNLPDLSLNPFVASFDFNQVKSLGLEPTANKTTYLAADLDAVFAQHLFNTTEKMLKSALVAGTFTSTIPANKMPFDGYWWDDHGLPLAAGPASPLGLYDSYMKARTQVDPQSSAWEAKNHGDVSAAWGGHCNGWAASSVLYPQPTKVLADPLTHQLITPYAQKGMLAEASFCVNWAFYGNRYWGNPGDDLRDIKPDLFHKVLVYYLNPTGRALAMDYERNAAVDNHVATGYKFVIQSTAANTFHVAATVDMHAYNLGLSDAIGTARPYTRSYAYTLTTDANGEITGGTWDATSDNPDFLWVPLSPSAQCGWKNPNLNPSKIVELINTLPEAKLKTVTLNQDISQKLAPQATYTIPFSAIVGDKVQLTIDVKAPTAAGTILTVTGPNRSPTTNSLTSYYRVGLPLGVQTLTIPNLLGVSTLTLTNPAATAQTVALTIKEIKVLSAQ